MQILIQNDISTGITLDPAIYMKNVIFFPPVKVSSFDLFGLPSNIFSVYYPTWSARKCYIFSGKFIH
jgi:hypothetical protein